MGLAVEVGALADLEMHDPEGAGWLRAYLAAVNEVLRENGLPEHHEPVELPELSTRVDILGFPYSFLHHLRRFYARATTDPDWIPAPTPEGEDPSQDSVLEEEMYMMSSHLLCHSDCEGFYLPIDFDEILIDSTNQDRIPGGILGSSHRLQEELVEIAPKLGIRLQGGKLTDPEAERINAEVESETELWIENCVWLSLYEAARLSIEHGTAVHFS